MKKIFLSSILFLLVFSFSSAQKSSLIVLGDLHYDLLEDHDMEWLKTKPDDLRQVTQEYTVYTDKFFKNFMTVLKEKALRVKPPVKAIVQLGDLSEGLAGSEEKARQMAHNTMKVIEETNMPAPWILAKGNHDVTGPGAPEAFKEFYVPMLRKQTGNDKIENASYSYEYGNVLITCLDPWDRNTDMVEFLEQELSRSKAKIKFVAVHEPVIPVTERCWNVLRRNPEQREKLLEVIAKHKAIVLSAHLHRYSVVSRNTPWGPIVQVMAISVIKDKDYLEPSYMITEYGPSLAENKPDWQPETLEARKAVLAEEAKYVTFYKQTDLPGYALLKINEKRGTVHLEYYAAFGKKPFDKVNLTRLLEQ